jgi:cytochrome c553
MQRTEASDTFSNGSSRQCASSLAAVAACRFCHMRSAVNIRPEASHWSKLLTVLKVP